MSQRAGFQTCTTSDMRRSKLADAAWDLRRLQGLKRPKISDILIHTRLPQAFGDYFKNGRACALGVLCIKSGAMEPNGWRKQPDWSELHDYFNCTQEELQRSVYCPINGCYHNNCIISMIPHLNDMHKRTNTEIGYWLKQYNL